MSETNGDHHRGIVLKRGEPLIMVPEEVDGEIVTRVFFSFEDARAASTPRTRERALAAIGSLKDLDWDEMADALDRIRHESPPTPPFEFE